MKYLYSIFFLFIVLSFRTQPRLKVDKKRFYIGEQITLQYEMEYFSKEGSIHYIPWVNQIPLKDLNLQKDTLDEKYLEMINPFHDTIIRLNKKKNLWIAEYKATYWDSGIFLIPKQSISLQNKVFHFPEVKIQVLFPKVEPNAQIKDIKEQFGTIPSKFSFKWIFWAIGLILFVLLVWFLFQFLKKKKNEIISQMSANELALRDLEDLFKKELWKNKDDIKNHYLILSTILKTYLSHVFKLHFIDKTSAEIVLLMKQLNINQEYLHELKISLEEFDMIKFAKSFPNEKKVFQHKASVISFIEKSKLYA